MESQSSWQKEVWSLTAKNDRKVQLTFIDHHHRQQHAEDAKECAVDVVLHAVADLRAETKHKDESSHVEEDSKSDVSKRPSIIKGSNDQDDLRQDVNRNANDREQELDNEKPHDRCWSHASHTLESRNCDEKADSEYDCRANAERLSGSCQPSAEQCQVRSDLPIATSVSHPQRIETQQSH